MLAPEKISALLEPSPPRQGKVQQTYS